MAKNKFSAAPWHVEDCDRRIHICDADGIHLSEISEWDEEYEEEQTANILLMLAAPHLLEALEGLVGEAALELGEKHPPVVAARAAIRIAREGA